MSHTALSAEIHADNVTAGWWNDIHTGQRLDRNLGELICLAHTEITEAYEGYRVNLQDDKLPHRPMVEVEIADMIIRIYDILGSQAAELDILWAHLDATEVSLADEDAAIFFVELHGHLDRALEGYRKQDTGKAHINLLRAIWHGLNRMDFHDYDVSGAIEEKRAFNKARLDHQIENRKAANGKKF